MTRCDRIFQSVKRNRVGTDKCSSARLKVNGFFISKRFRPRVGTSLRYLESTKTLFDSSEVYRLCRHPVHESFGSETPFRLERHKVTFTGTPNSGGRRLYCLLCWSVTPKAVSSQFFNPLWSWSLGSPGPLVVGPNQKSVGDTTLVITPYSSSSSCHVRSFLE